MLVCVIIMHRIYPAAAETSARAFTSRRCAGASRASPGTIGGSMSGGRQYRIRQRRGAFSRSGRGRRASTSSAWRSAEPLREGGERLREWQEAGMAADMGYMHRPVELLSNPKKLQKSARSVVSLGVSYYPGDHPENEGGGRVARYAWGRDYHEVIKARLFRLREELEEELGVRIKARGFTDAVPLLERSAAQHAGLGFFGRNSCLINGEIGSYFFIADLIVDLDLEPDPPGTGTCGRCTRCMDRCPTGAIKAPGVVDARLCISYLTIENRGEIPRELRPKVGDWAFGCDVCQEVCPYNKTKASRSRWPEFSGGGRARTLPEDRGGPRRSGPRRSSRSASPGPRSRGPAGRACCATAAWPPGT